MRRGVMDYPWRSVASMKPVGNPWETRGKPVGNPWETRGKIRGSLRSNTES
jgi:hypothetical protein